MSPRTISFAPGMNRRIRQWSLVIRTGDSVPPGPIRASLALLPRPIGDGTLLIGVDTRNMESKEDIYEHHNELLHDGHSHHNGDGAVNDVEITAVAKHGDGRIGESDENEGTSRQNSEGDSALAPVHYPETAHRKEQDQDKPNISNHV